MVHEHFEDLEVANGRQDLTGLYFNLDLPENGKPGTNVLIRYSQGSYHKWEYRTSDEKYYRYGDKEVAEPGDETFSLSTDRLNDEPITADNVVLLMAKYQYYSVNPEIVEIDFMKPGKAYVFRDGQVILVNWDRPSKDDLLTFSTVDGTPFPFKPGNTWFVVIGETSLVLDEAGNWVFEFKIP